MKSSKRRTMMSTVARPLEQSKELKSSAQKGRLATLLQKIYENSRGFQGVLNSCFFCVLQCIPTMLLWRFRLWSCIHGRCGLPKHLSENVFNGLFRQAVCLLLLNKLVANIPNRPIGNPCRVIHPDFRLCRQDCQRLRTSRPESDVDLRQRRVVHVQTA